MSSKNINSESLKFARSEVEFEICAGGSGRRPELDRPVGDERVVPAVPVGGAQRQQQLPLLGVFQQDAAHEAAGAELGSVVVDVGDAHCDGGDVLQESVNNISLDSLIIFNYN